MVLVTTPPQPASNARMMLRVGLGRRRRREQERVLELDARERVASSVVIMAVSRKPHDTAYRASDYPACRRRPLPVLTFQRMPRTVRGGLIQVKADVSARGVHRRRQAAG